MAGTNSTSIFQTLMTFLGGKAGDKATTWLETQGVAAPVASMVGGAISNPGTVSLPADTTLTLGAAITPFLPQGVALPASCADATIRTLSFTLAASDASMAFAGEIEVPLHLGNASPVNLDLNLSLSNSGGDDGSTDVQLAGTLPFGGQRLDATVDLSSQAAQGAATLRCSWKASGGDTISPSALWSSFGVGAPSLIDGLPDLGLTEVDFDLDLRTTDGQKVEIEAAYGAGEAFVVVDRPQTSGNSGGWVLVLGAQLENDLANWPIIGQELAKLPVKLAGGGLLLVSSANYSGLQIPDFGTRSTPFGPFPTDVTDRFMAIGVLDLGGATGAAGHVASIAAAPGSASSASAGQVLVTATLPTARLKATLGERNLFKRFPLAKLTLSLGATPPFFQLDGEVAIALGHKDAQETLTFDARLNVTDEEVTGSLDAQTSTPIALPGISGLPSVNIGELGGLMGIDFTKQEVVAGLMAKFSFGGSPPAGGPPDASGFQTMMPTVDGTIESGKPVRPSADECALVLGINDDAVVLPVPDVDLLLLSIADADLTEILGSVLPGVSVAACEALLGDIKVSNLLLYWCDEAPKGLVLPDGTAMDSGFRFHGGLDVWGSFQAWAALDVTTAAGFTGDAVMSPVRLGKVLSLSGLGTVLPDSDAAAAGILSGGPLLHVSTVESPYLKATWDAEFFGKPFTTGNLVIARDQFDFDLTGDLPGVHGAVSCQLASHFKHFEARFSLQVKGSIQLPELLDVSMPAISLDDAIDLALTVDVQGGFALSVDGSFTFQGATVTIPTLQLDESFSDLEQLPNELLQHLQQEAHSIFSDAYQDAEEFIQKFGDDLSQAAADAEKFLNSLKKDVRGIVTWLVGQRHSHKKLWPNGTIVTGGTTSTLQWAVVQSNLLRMIPDEDTFNQLPGHDQAQNIGPAFASIPTDTVQMPSRKNGTVVTRRKDGALFLILNDEDGNGDVFGATFHIRDATAFKNGATSAPNPPAFEPDPPSTGDDIAAIPVHQQLKHAPCCIGVQGAAELDAFVDGIRYPIPDMGTKALLTSAFASTYWIRQDAWNAIPAGPALPSLQVGSVVKHADDDAVYVVGPDNKLHAFQNYQSFTDWGYSDDKIVKCPVAIKGLFNVGGDASKKPPKQAVAVD